VSSGQAWTDPNTPNLADFTSFIYNNVGVPVAALPLGSQWPGFAFTQTMAMVSFYPTVTPIEYVLAVYNCGAHILLRITPDQVGQTFFADARKTFKVLSPETGIIQSSSDEGTSNSFAVGQGMQNLTIGDLNFYTTPYGREYLAYAMDGGPGLWGLT
jgi:hypothetical protein